MNSPEVLELLSEFDTVFTPHISEQVDLVEYSQKLSRNAYFVIAQNEEETSKEGFIAYYLNLEKQIVYIPFIGVKSSSMHIGLGHIMLENLFVVVRGFKTIMLEVRKFNIHAYNFYMRNGFEIVEDRQGKWLLSKDISNS